MPVNDRPGGDTNSSIESPGLKNTRDTRLVSIPIGAGPDVEDDEDDDDAAGVQDRAVQRWLNGPARDRT